jgi:hypothetical protein
VSPCRRQRAERLDTARRLQQRSTHTGVSSGLPILIGASFGNKRVRELFGTFCRPSGADFNAGANPPGLRLGLIIGRASGALSGYRFLKSR